MTKKDTTKKSTSKSTKKVTTKKVEEVVEPTIEPETIIDDSKPRRRLYFSYTTRLIIYLLVFVTLFGFGYYFLFESVKLNDEQILEYKETGNVDYKVYLKDNDFYEEKYLGKDMKYVASLIKNIDIDFAYTYNINESKDINIERGISAKLKITDKGGNNSFYEKTYNLMPSKSESFNNEKIININENVKIDYDYYNKIANDFRNNYGVDTESSLIVYMTIKKSDSENSNYGADDILSITIPLSEKAIDVNLDYVDIDQNSYIVREKELTITDYFNFEIFIGLIIIAIIYLIKFIRLLNSNTTKKNEYDKTVDKLLKEYDRLIAESSTMLSLEDKEIVKIKNFTELIDVRDNLKLPILYYVVAKHQKCHFYIADRNILYLYTLKASDLESKNEK